MIIHYRHPICHVFGTTDRWLNHFQGLILGEVKALIKLKADNRPGISMSPNPSRENGSWHTDSADWVIRGTFNTMGSWEKVNCDQYKKQNVQIIGWCEDKKLNYKRRNYYDGDLFISIYSYIRFTQENTISAKHCSPCFYILQNYYNKHFTVQ